MTEYKNYSRRVNTKVIDTKKHYERRKFRQKSHKPKQFFNYIKRRTESSEPVANLIDTKRDRLGTLDSEKAELLRRQYCSVFTRDTGVLHDCPQTVLRDTICDISVDDCDIIRAMRQINSHSAPSPGGIQPNFINNSSGIEWTCVCIELRAP